MAHKGFSLIDVFSPCGTYNKINTYPWFKRVYKLERTKVGILVIFISPTRKLSSGATKYRGVIYKTEMPTYEDGEPAFKKALLPSKNSALALTPSHSWTN
ncbi:MAG: hypothetical protein R3F51_26745 [Cyanobacteriota/Melainabacteria group bacterium]